MMNHKEGCVYDRTKIHRVPIDCITVPQLFDSIDHLKQVVEHQKRELIELKAQIYDLEKEAGE